MSQIMYRIYRTSINDPFQPPRGWLTFSPCQMWVPSESLGKTDVFTAKEAERIAHDWNEYWISKGMDYRAHKERAIG